MAWIESHQELAKHPKTLRLARALKLPIPTVLGHLHLLWWWALDYAEDGSLAKYEPADLADAVLFDGEPQALVDGLVRAGFLNSDLSVHDWGTYVGRLLAQRAKNAERMRKARAEHVSNSAGATVPDLDLDLDQKQSQERPPPAAEASEGKEPAVLNGNGMTDRQKYLLRRLWEHDKSWGDLGPAVVNRCSKVYGKQVTTDALARLREFPPEHVDDPAALLVDTCLKVQEVSA